MQHDEFFPLVLQALLECLSGVLFSPPFPFKCEPWLKYARCCNIFLILWPGVDLDRMEPGQYHERIIGRTHSDA